MGIIQPRSGVLTYWQNLSKLLTKHFLVPVAVAVAIMLFIGIVTLVAWKILVDLHDKREYRKFAEEAASNGFDVAENPIYRPPAVNINNPAYCGRTEK